MLTVVSSVPKSMRQMSRFDRESDFHVDAWLAEA